MSPLEPSQTVDIAVVGAGAAGLMTAISAAREARSQGVPSEIILFDTKQKIGAKILMSGGTRCNVTNLEVTPFDYEGGASHFVKHVLEAFTPEQTIRFFKEIGVELVLGPSGKYFPATHSAKTVLDALIREAERLGIKLKTGVRIDEIKKWADLFHLRNRDGTFEAAARKAVLTTGGLSYPTTGSDGAGYRIAREFGHRIVDTFPALTPLFTQDSDWNSLSGLALDAKLSFFKNGRKRAETQGAFLFTHFGFSGPAALDISRHFAGARPEESPKIEASFLPKHTEESFKNLFEAAQKRRLGKFAKNFLAEEFGLPSRFADVFFKKIGLDGSESILRCSRGRRAKLGRMLFHYPLEVTGVYGYQKAEVTAGGVDLKEVNVSTMESKLVPGLYFAGEILDADGRIGGFNFQWAWSTGAVAGRSAARSLE